jgi:polyphosphate kinase
MEYGKGAQRAMSAKTQPAHAISDLTPAPQEPTVSLPVLEPNLYINRELSWLEFNRRVLEEMQEDTTPLLERVKFAAIFSSNLDEFYMIRVAGVKRKVVAGIPDRGPDGRTPDQQLKAIHKVTQELLNAHAHGITAELFPALKKAGIEIVDYRDLEKDERTALGSVFEREVFPVLTPQAVDRGRRFPHVSNDSVNLIVVLRTAHGSRFARVKVPALLPRFVPVPSSVPEGESGQVLAGSLLVTGKKPIRFALLEQLISAHLDRLFPGSEVVASYPFHLIRDSDVEPDEEDEDAEDLMEIMRETLSQRPFGTVVRIDIDSSMPSAVRSWLLEQVHANRRDLYVIDGPLGMENLIELTRLDRPDLMDPPLVPASLFPARATNGASTPDDVFATLRKHDVLIHLPYMSFNGVVDFVRAASLDPDVVAIKQTLYRVGKDSPLIPALIEARDEDTQVAVLVELKARFDEENNISWAQTLEKYGVHVAYGLAGLKTHCKLTMVVRREPDGLRRYVHISTGNYNANTARIYEDIGILTSREDLASDVTELFNVLTGYSEHASYNKLWVAPAFMRYHLIEAVFAEIASHREQGNGHIILKMNSLVDRETIRALYAASQAGVRVDLIVRGICCLRPGVPGWSETIRVISLVGRFLEHSRIFAFRNNDDPRVYIGSADAMERNFDRRVEVITPVDSPELRDHIRTNVLSAYLRDTVNARELQSDGAWIPVKPVRGEKPFDVQRWFRHHYRAGAPIGATG